MKRKLKGWPKEINWQPFDIRKDIDSVQLAALGAVLLEHRGCDVPKHAGAPASLA
jgi:hypothetical protein